MTRVVNPSRRRGAVLPLTAILLVVLLAMVAVSVDVGYVCWTRAELQNAADAAALAGASQLVLPHVPGSSAATTGTQNAVNNAVAQAQLFAGYHRAGGVSLTVPAGDIVVGSQAAAGSNEVAAWSSGGPFPTTVQVTVRRSSAANGPVPLFFGPILGAKNWSGSATATVTVQRAAAAVTGFSGSPKAPLPPLLPVAVDASFWSTFVAAGTSPDGAVHDSFTVALPTPQERAPHNVASGADGIPEFNSAYPNNTSPGNFGLVSLKNSKATDTPTYGSWVDSGPSASDLQSFGTSGPQATPAAPLTMYGGPGLHSSLSSDFQSIVGQPRIVPLFSSYSGNGSNAQYTVTGFAGVTVVSATGNGSNFQLVLQPTIVVNANATVQAGAQTGSAFLYASPPFGLTDGAVAQTSSQSASSAGSGSGSSGSSAGSGSGNNGNGSGNNGNGSGNNGNGSGTNGNGSGNNGNGTGTNGNGGGKVGKP